MAIASRTTPLTCGLGAVTVALLLTGLAQPAFAAPGDTSTDTVLANVGVTSAITLSGLTPAFTLNGLPGATVAGPAAVTMLVETNNIAGYSVTVQAADNELLPADTTANTDVIPIGALSVRETGTTSYTALSDTNPVTVHTQATRSASGGDAISNDYQVVIPFVNADLYTATLDYVATTL